jgi:putative aldouronate transport system substrate-binding protein
MKRMMVMMMLMVGLVSAVFATGRQQQQEESIITLTTNWAGVGKVDHGVMWHILKTKFGIEIDRISQGNEALMTAIAGGNLPDIVSISGEMFYAAVEAGLLVDLDAYKDRLPHVHANLAAGLEYNRDMVKARGLNAGAYAVPTGLRDVPAPITNKYDVGPFLRWDYYYQMGYPELKTIDDYIPLVREMLARFPVDENGNPNIGFSFDGGADKDRGYVLEATRYAKMHGQLQVQFLEIDVATDQIHSIFDDDSYYKKGLQYLFNVNQAGLLDQNAITQTANQWREKTATGRILVHFTGYSWTNFWNDERERQGIYYGFVPFTNERIPNTNAAPVYTPGTAGGHGLSAKMSARELDKALNLLDYGFSYDGTAVLTWAEPGIEGGIWDIIDGKPVPRGTFNPDTGGVLVFGGGAGHPLYNTEYQQPGMPFGIELYMVHPTWGEPLMYSSWSSWDTSYPGEGNLFQQQRMEVYGKYGITTGGVIDLSRKMGIELPVRPYTLDAVPEEIDIINKRIGNVAVTDNWRMIYARNQAEFDRIWNEFKVQANGMGLAQSLAWYRDAYTRAVNSAQKYVDLWNTVKQIP